MKTKQDQRIDAIIFDLTGTTIDMSSSQANAVALTINRYFGKEVIIRKEIGAVWGLAGYNNAWDATYALTRLIEEGVPREEWATASQRYLPVDRSTLLFKQLYDMFQTFYLGSARFRDMEGANPPFTYEPGLIMQEKSFIPPALLTELKKKGYKIGIATGCPRNEAIISLANLGLLGPDGFDERHLVGLEDTPRTKPYPDPLLEAKRRLGAKNPLYIGDNASDIEASRAAGMPCLYVGAQTTADDPDRTLTSQVLRSLL